MNCKSMKKRLNLKRYKHCIRKNRLGILITIILFVAIGVFFNFKPKDDMYQARASVYSDLFVQYGEEGQIKYSDADYRDVAISYTVAEKAAVILEDIKLEGEDIKKMVSCKRDKNSPIYYIYVENSDPQVSMKIADAVAKAFSLEMNGIEEGRKTKVLDESYEAVQIYNGRYTQILNIVLYAVAGLLISFLWIFIVSVLSNKIEIVDDVTLDGELEILGVIPSFDVD